jgi:hypothetical protein
MDKTYLFLYIKYLFLKLSLWLLKSNILGIYTRYIYTYLLYNQIIISKRTNKQTDDTLPNKSFITKFNFNFDKLKIKSHSYSHYSIWIIYYTKYSELFNKFLDISSNLILYYPSDHFERGYFYRRWFMFPLDYIFYFFPTYILHPLWSLFIYFFRLFILFLQIPFILINYPIITLISY